MATAMRTDWAALPEPNRMGNAERAGLMLRLAPGAASREPIPWHEKGLTDEPTTLEGVRRH
jgi:hypothetical protein